jgi:type III secretion system (T3SS) inner membrane Yop/YscD-like protein
MSNDDREKHNQTKFLGSTRPSTPLDTEDKGTQLPGRQVLAKIMVLDGPGAGTSLAVYSGDNAIGRSPENRIALAFGDEAIHRVGHAWITARDGKFSIEHGGKSNPLYVNGEKVSDRRPIGLGDQIKVGATTLRLDPI